jgi:hypothetical protein
MDLLQTTLVRGSRLVCPDCISPLQDIISYHHIPKLLLFSIGDNQIAISKTINIRTGMNVEKFYLKGIIYHGGFHFTSRIIKDDGNVWFHDGQLGRACIYEKHIVQFDSNEIRNCDQRNASLIVYAQN